MEGGGSMQSNEERGAERLMDDYLKSIGFHRKKIAKDGSCLFRAVAEQVLHCQSLHTEVRATCVEFLRQNRGLYEAFIEGDFEEYLLKLQDPQQWVGEVEINALAAVYKRDFEIFQTPGNPAVNITDNNFKDKVRLCFLNGNHYDSVYPVGHIKAAALCQSVLYELLYDGVFKVDRSSLGPCHRVSRPCDLLSDDNMAACGSSDESDFDETLWVENETSTTATRHNSHSYRGRGRGRFLPERVRRSLNPTLFRNIEYDVWHKSKRAQQKMDYCIAAGMQFTVGDRCQVRLEGSGRSYNATVKEVTPNNGPATVYIEELGKKQVPLWSLRPLSEEGSWSTVVNRDKRLSNGHGEWEERGRGRGRAKNVPASSSVAPATGSGVRVQKQHSWPSQATVDEAKAARKSVSSVEAAFGLTEKERLAKEEEERNVALVEIQLRDEHSFPALGAQAGQEGDGGKRRGGEKRRSQRNKTKSPVEDVRAASPSAGETSTSSTPPLAAANTTTPPPNPTLPAAKPPAAPSADSDPSWLGSLKAAMPGGNMAAASTSTTAAAVTTSTSRLPPTCGAPTAKTNAPRAVAPAAPASPPAAQNTKRCVSGGAVPPSVPSSATVFSFLTPNLPPASSPTNPPPSPPPPFSSSKPPPKSSVSPPPPPPPPSSSLPPPTFIAPIAPSPTAAQGFLPPSALPHSPSPPSSSLIHQAAQLHQPPPFSARPRSTSQTFQNPAGYQVPPRAPLPQNQSRVSESQTESQSWPPPHQHPPQAQAGVASVPQIQTPVSHFQAQSPHPAAPGPPHPHPSPSQASAPVPRPHLHPVQPPHPSQVPHPSLSLSASPTRPCLQSQTPHTQNQPEPPLPHPESPAPPQQSHPPHQVQSAPPPPHHHQPVPGAVPLQQLSQLYQDPLYPGFPEGEKGDVAPNPPFSSSKTGDDLPHDVNILRFFFNLGVKAYSMPMFPPYIYLLPLQQAHTLQPKLPSRSPSPHFPHSNPPSRHQEAYPHPPYPPSSAPMPPQYDHQAPLAEPPPHPSEPSFSQPGYPVTQPPPHRMPPSWQQQQMPPPRNPSYPVGYPTSNPAYAVPPPLSQGYHPGQGPGHQMYPQYPPSSLGYHPPPAPEELHVSQGAMEQRQPTNGDTMPGKGPGRVPGPLESPAAANVANANNHRPVVHSGFGIKEPGRAVLLVDPPLNNNPILVSNPGLKDVPVSMTTMKPSSTPGSPSHYDIISAATITSDINPSRVYRPHRRLGGAEPGQVGYLATVAMAEPLLSVGCSTEDDWDEPMGFKPPSMNHRGARRSHRGGGGGGGRGRGGHDPGRGAHRRRQGDAGAGFSFVQYSSSHRGRGRERGY